MKNNYRIVCGRYDTFSSDYDMKKEIRCAARYNAQGFAEVKEIVAHSIDRDTYRRCDRYYRRSFRRRIL